MDLLVAVHLNWIVSNSFGLFKFVHFELNLEKTWIQNINTLKNVAFDFCESRYDDICDSI